MAKKPKKAPEKQDGPIQIQLHEPRRFFCDSAFAVFNEECFVLALQTGNVVSAEYAFTPKHAKRLMLYLQDRIAEYEKNYGELKASLSKVDAQR